MRRECTQCWTGVIGFVACSLGEDKAMMVKGVGFLLLRQLSWKKKKDYMLFWRIWSSSPAMHPGTL